MLPEALEHLRRQVMDQAQRQQDKTQRAIFREKAKNVYGMTADAIRQMICRGPRTPKGTPDWNALEAQLKRKTVAQGGDNQRLSLSDDAMRKLIEHLDRRIARAETKKEHDMLWEHRLTLQQELGGAPL
jgi:uncharacterized tellurite resistance protein B-like protein